MREGIIEEGKGQRGRREIVKGFGEFMDMDHLE